MHARRDPGRAKPRRQEPEALREVGETVFERVPGGPDGDEISLADTWQVLTRHRRLILGLMLLAALISSATALLMTPLYRADVLLSPVADLDDAQHDSLPLSDFGNLAALAGIKVDRKDRREESIATLQSRQFTQNFIRTHKLLPLLFADRWDAAAGRWKAGLSEKRIPTLWDGYEKFSEEVGRIRRDRSTGLVTLSVEWSDPELAAQWANAMVGEVNAVLRHEAVETSNNAIAYLQDQLTRTTVVELQQVLHRLIESEMKKIILANIHHDYAFKVIDKAVVPEEPFRPNPVSLVTLGTLGGLFVGILLALLLNATRRPPVERTVAARPKTASRV